MILPDVSAWAVPVLTMLGGGGFGMLIKTVLDHQRLKRAQTDTVALSLVDTLKGRIDTLEKEMKRERELCDAKISRVERQSWLIRTEADALDSMRRHQGKNSRQVIVTLLDLLELAPQRVGEIVERTRQRLSEIDDSEAKEREAFMAARMAATAALIEPEPTSPPEELEGADA